jgi:hypothetical protein
LADVNLEMEHAVEQSGEAPYTDSGAQAVRYDVHSVNRRPAHAWLTTIGSYPLMNADHSSPQPSLGIAGIGGIRGIAGMGGIDGIGGIGGIEGIGKIGLPPVAPDLNATTPPE